MFKEDWENYKIDTLLSFIENVKFEWKPKY